LVTVCCCFGVTGVIAQEHIQAPKPTVPEIYNLEGEFVRIAYNNEGWVTLGYRTANSFQGKDWMLLETGVTVRDKHAGQDLTRDSFKLKLPDGSLVPLATQTEYQGAGYLREMNRNADNSKDSVNYFPSKANQAYKIPLFSMPGQQIMAVDKFEVNWTRAGLGRIFFKLPEGTTVQPGQYWLVVTFKNGPVEVPFRILTDEEEKFLRKNWKDIKKQYEAFLKKEAEKAKQQ
jgi:hypothetical protein